MKIAELITEEVRRYYAAYHHEPEFIFLGDDQMAEIDAMVEELKQFGWIVADAKPKRATYSGMQIFRVDAKSHLSFGIRQPSPCG